MAENKDKSHVRFGDFKRNYSREEEVSCQITFDGYQFSAEDKVVLWECSEGEAIKCLTFRLPTEGDCLEANDGQEKVVTVPFESHEFFSSSTKEFRFKFLTPDLRVLAESNDFFVDQESASNESFLAVDVTDSFDENCQLAVNASDDKIEFLEKECDELKKKLNDSYHKIEMEETCCKFLQDDKLKIANEWEEEKRLREKAELAIETLEQIIADKTNYINDQDVKIQELERSFQMEARLHEALKEDFEGETSNNEECIAENEKLKMKLIEYRREYTRLNKLNEDERDFYKNEFSKHDSELLKLKHIYQQKLEQIESKLEETEENLNCSEKKLIEEKEHCLELENELNELAKVYDEQIELKEYEAIELKKDIEEIQEILKAEKDGKAKLIKDYEGTIEELEKKLNSEVKRVNSITKKCTEMQKKTSSSEKEVTSLKSKLEEADKKMKEMEDLVQNSKSELEILQRTVSATDSTLDKQDVEPVNVDNGNKKNKAERKIPVTDKEKTSSKVSLRSSKSKEYAIADSKIHWTREKSSNQSSNFGKNKNSGTTISFNCMEPRRPYGRYSGKRRSEYDGSIFYDKDRQRSHQRNGPEKADKQIGLLRQHRNALLRENSRLRYSMKMLNHDCAILNFTLQQVILEAEHKLESLYSMYMKKESECAAYESMFNPNPNMVNNYDPYAMAGDYVEAYMPDASYMQDGTIIQPGYEYYGENFYDGYEAQDPSLQQTFAMDQMQYQYQYPYQEQGQYHIANQVYFVPQGYIPEQIQYAEAPAQVQYEVPVLAN